MRPILFDINAALDSPVKIERPSIPLRLKLLGSLPLINVITGVTVAALTLGRRRGPGAELERADRARRSRSWSASS